MYGNEMVTDTPLAVYECRYETELVSLRTIVTARGVDEAYVVGIAQIEEELGVEIVPLYWEAVKEADL